MIKYRDPVTGQWEKLPYIPGNSGLPAVTPEMYGAKGDGKTDDTEAIQKAVDACQSYGTLYFSNRTYRVSGPIIVGKKLNIEGRGACIKPAGSSPVTFANAYDPEYDNSTEPISVDAVFLLVNQGGEPVSIRGLRIDGDGLVGNGFHVGGMCTVTKEPEKTLYSDFVLGGSDLAHATQITFRDCSVTKALGDGFRLVPTAYCIRFRDCYAVQNGGSGISAVATGTGAQVNSITIDGCTLALNRKHGAHVNGVHMVVTNCTVESNGMIKNAQGAYEYTDADAPYSGIFIGYKGYHALNIQIRGNYMEPSAYAQICVYSGAYATVDIRENYLLGATSKAPVGHKVTHVRCVKAYYTDAAGARVSESSVRLRMQSNTVTGERELDVDGGDVLDQFSVVDAQYVQHAMLTKLTYPPSHGTRYHIPLSLFSGDPCDGNSINTSVNLVENVGKEYKVILPLPLYNCVLRWVGFHVVTDGTTPTVVIGIRIIKSGGAEAESVTYTLKPEDFKDFGKNGTLYGNALNNLGYYNIPNDHFVEVTFKLASIGDASSFVISNPFIDIYNP